MTEKNTNIICYDLIREIIAWVPLWILKRLSKISPVLHKIIYESGIRMISYETASEISCVSLGRNDMAIVSGDNSKVILRYITTKKGKIYSGLFPDGRRSNGIFVYENNEDSLKKITVHGIPVVHNTIRKVLFDGTLFTMSFQDIPKKIYKMSIIKFRVIFKDGSFM